MDFTKSGFSEPRNSVKEIFEAAYDNNPQNLQKALRALKFHDTNPLISIMAVIWKFNVSLAEAKEIVLTSDPWKQ